jgi:hypothetical protein
MQRAQLLFRKPKIALQRNKINMRTCTLQRNMPTFVYVEPLHFSQHFTVSLVWWINCLLPASTAVVCVLGMHLHFSNWDLLLAMSRYIGDPDVIPDHQPQSVLCARDSCKTLATSCFSHLFCPSSILMAGHRLW